MNIIVTPSICQHQQLAFMNTTGGAVCVGCNAWFAADSPEGQRAEAAWNVATAKIAPSSSSIPAESFTEADLRHAWEAGFRLCRGYADNHAHWEGDQRERCWQAFMFSGRVSALAGDSMTKHQACAHGWGEGPDCPCEFCREKAGPSPEGAGSPERIAAEPIVSTLAERAAWYREGCPGLEDVEGYFASGDCARDAASDLETALSEIRVLESVLRRMRGEKASV